MVAKKGVAAHFTCALVYVLQGVALVEVIDFTVANLALGDQTLEVLCALSVSLNVTRQAEATTCEDSEKLLCEVVAVVVDRVVLVCRVLLAHSRNQHVVDLKGGQLAHRLVLDLALDRDLEFEREGTVTLGFVEIDPRLTRHRASAV